MPDIKDVEIFDRRMGAMFPSCASVLAEVWDRPSITSILKDLAESGASLHAAFPLGKLTKKADRIVLEEAGIALVDSKSKSAYRVGLPLRITVARFSSQPTHNFIRIYFGGLENNWEKETVFFLGEDSAGDKAMNLKSVGKPGWLLVYPAGSLLCDQRLERRVRELALQGKDASLFVEFMAVEEGEFHKNQNIELVDYTPEDAKLWEQWLGKMDTNMFQTIVRPRNFSSASGRSDDYYLKIIRYGRKKVGAVWLEKINSRNGTAELGLLIGEPHLWGMGLGSKAMVSMIDIAKNDLGIKFLWVSVREANQRAVNCYKRGGFLIVRKVPVFNKSDGSYQIWVHMEKMI